MVLVRGTHSLRCLKFHVETLTKQRSYLNEDGLVSESSKSSLSSSESGTFIDELGRLTEYAHVTAAKSK